MFNLENAIHEWSHRGQQAESATRADMDELEEHLREAIASFVKKGLTEEEAFLVAARRLGEHDALGEEYGKVNSGTFWGKRVLWMVFGYLGGIALASAISALGKCIVTFSAYLGYGGMSAGVAGVVTCLASWVAVALLLYVRTRQNDAAPVTDFISTGWLALLVLVMGVGAWTGMAARSMHARLVSMDQFSTSIWWTSVGGLFIQGSIIVAGIILILTTRVRLTDRSALNVK